MKFGSQTTILSCYCLFLFTLTTAIGRSNTQYTSNQSYRSNFLNLKLFQRLFYSIFFIFQACATNQDVFFAIKNDCTKFVRCFNGFRYDFTCPEGTVFDKVRKICNHPRKVRGKCSRLESKFYLRSSITYSCIYRPVRFFLSNYFRSSRMHGRK